MTAAGRKRGGVKNIGGALQIAIDGPAGAGTGRGEGAQEVEEAVPTTSAAMGQCSATRVRDWARA